MSLARTCVWVIRLLLRRKRTLGGRARLEGEGGRGHRQVIGRLALFALAVGVISALAAGTSESAEARITCPPVQWHIYDGPDAGLAQIAHTRKVCLVAFVIDDEGEALEFHWDRGGRILRDISSDSSLSAAFGQGETLVIVNRKLGKTSIPRSVTQPLWSGPTRTEPAEGCARGRWRLHEGESFPSSRVTAETRPCLDLYVFTRNVDTLEYHWDQSGALQREHSSERPLNEALGQSDTFVVTNQAVGDVTAWWTASAPDAPPASPPASQSAPGTSGALSDAGTPTVIAPTAVTPTKIMPDPDGDDDDGGGDDYDCWRDGHECWRDGYEWWRDYES